MKQIDNRQKQVIQSRAQRAFQSVRNLFNSKEKAKGRIHLPSEKSVHSESDEEKKTTPEAAVYHAGPKVGRNDPCPCGSGKKYKKCCLGKV